MPFQVKEATALARRIHAGAVYTAADKKTNKRKIQRKKKGKNERRTNRRGSIKTKKEKIHTREPPSPNRRLRATTCCFVYLAHTSVTLSVSVHGRPCYYSRFLSA